MKVVLMSATIEAHYFASYFSTRVSGRVNIRLIIKVEGSPHEVHEFFLEDIAHIGEVTCGVLESPPPHIAPKV